MSDPRNDDRDGGAPRDRVLDDLGQLVRDKRARGEGEYARYKPLSDERRAAIIGAVLGEGKPAVVAEPQAVGRDRGWLVHLVGYSATAAAAAAVAVMVGGTERHITEMPLPTATSDEPVTVAPAFGSWDIRGGGPAAEHLGEPKTASVVCLGRPLSLTFAVAPQASIDRGSPLQLLLVVRGAEDRGYPLLYDVSTDDRFSWTDDGRALVFEGTLEGLAPVSPGTWVLEPSLGAPGSCSREDRHGCQRLPARAFEVLERERCDEPR